MTLPSAPDPISASQIRAEFVGSTPFVFSDYFAGGPFVPEFTVGDNGEIPSSGTLKFSDFYGSEDVLPTALFMTVGTFLTQRGFGAVGFGTLVPDTFKGQTVTNIFGDSGPPNVVVSIGVAGLAQGFWNQLVIDGGGPTLLSKDAVHDPNAGSSTIWTFTGNTFFFPNATYTVTFL